jgi:hypothetical protein
MKRTGRSVRRCLVANIGEPIPFEDKKAVEDVAYYLVKAPLSLKRSARRARISASRSERGLARPPPASGTGCGRAPEVSAPSARLQTELGPESRSGFVVTGGNVDPFLGPSDHPLQLGEPPPTWIHTPRRGSSPTRSWPSSSARS